ncbi:hypothetical protein MPF_0768 [Methanohalophilus portucalensis FDF-1]|uniref:Uncharacterized protein n=1 Tax=Methanohalophilus portucalensis FDF-1 TaxID=523843 RepID=A0A1L9C680_9EURY|nr:hypothetical protein MPF_0768 [Methanohalophilus portucalensis FDF-1]
MLSIKNTNINTKPALWILIDIFKDCIGYDLKYWEFCLTFPVW